MRVARMGERGAVEWLDSKWHHMVYAVCALHVVLKLALFMHKVPVCHCPA